MSFQNQLDLHLSTKILEKSITCALDKNLLISQANSNFLSLTGYSPNELIRQPLANFLTNAQSNTVYNFLKKEIKQGETWKGELQIQHKDSSTIWLDTEVNPVSTENSELIYLLTLVDITQRKSLITKLEQRAHRQGLIAILGQLSLNNIPIQELLDQTLSVICGSLDINKGVTLELSVDGKISLVKSAYNTSKMVPGKTIIPVNESNILGQTLLQMEPLIDTASQTQYIPDILKREGDHEFICCIIGDNKYPFGILCLLSSKRERLNFDEGNFIKSACNILAEAINRKNMEMSIRYERELSKKYLDVAEIMILVYDIQGNILLANKHASSVLGYEQSELSGINFIDCFIPDNIRNTCRSILSEIINDNGYSINKSEFKDNIIPIINKNNKTRQIKWKTSLMYNKNGDISSILSAGDDITEQLVRKEEQKNLEKKLHQAQKMEAIGILAGGIAHDFNNILASILGFSDLIIEKISDSDPQLYEYITHIKNSGLKARDIIAQMQNINLQDESSVSPTPLTALLKSTMKILRSALPSTIALKLNIDEINAPVNLNASSFHHLMMKLLINSRDAINGHGEISVSLSTQSFSNQHCAACGAPLSSSYAVLSIADNGPGISANNISKAFANTAKTTADSGLAYAVKTTHESGGHIIISSHHLDKNYTETGSELKLLFNISHLQAEDTCNTQQLINSITPAEKSLMIIDDENSVATYLGELFKGAGFNVSVFCDSTEALSVFQNSCDSFDLIITDQTMLALSGDALATEMLKIKPDLPVILCTGHSTTVDKSKAQALNIQGFIKKPVDSAEILNLAFNLIANSSS